MCRENGASTAARRTARNEGVKIGVKFFQREGTMRRSFVALVAIALAFVGPAPIEAVEGTHCRHELEFTVTPGLSMNPTTGTHTGEGTITCDGPVNGKQPTGPGKITDEGPYGTKDPDTCLSGSEGGGTDTVEFPTADGIVKVVSEFTYFTEPSTEGGVLSVRFEGTRYTGHTEITPTEGDCVTAPVTKLKGFGEGTLHR
jgi:hypothetical protein